MSPPDGTAGLHRLGMRELPPRLRPLTAADLLALDLPPRSLVLDPWLPTQGLAMIHLARGVGKTHLALGIACAVATGGGLLGWAAPEPRRVIYLDGEMPAATMQRRMARPSYVAESSSPQRPSPPKSGRNLTVPRAGMRFAVSRRSQQNPTTL